MFEIHAPHKIKLSIVATMVLSVYGSLPPPSQAQTNSTITELGEIKVVSDLDDQDIQQKKVGETIKSAKQLKRQQVQDARDLVRYETGITAVEKGRFGTSGYAMRGVDENRVAITIDGLHQAETLSSQGFKELFEGYGNFNNTRNGAEVETLKQVQLAKGANSLKVGSGALGGAVIFKTKDARDFLTEKNWYVSYKKGYNSADRQHIDSMTLAGRYKWFDALLVKTKRDGHELQNYGYNHFDAAVQGKRREKADPYHKHLDSTLLKLSFQPTENHRFTVTADLYDSRSKGADLSYTLKATGLQKSNDPPELEYRHNNDQVKRTNYAFSYENYSSNPLWDTMKFTYSEQKIKTRARNEDYCDGNDKCNSSLNPLGIKYNKNNELVDKDGNPITYKYSNQKQTYYEYVSQDVFDTWNEKIPDDIKEKYEKLGVLKDVPTSVTSCYKDISSEHPDKCRIPIYATIITEQLISNGQVYSDLTLKENSKWIEKYQTNSPLLLSCDGISCDTKDKDRDGDSTIAVIDEHNQPKRLGFKVDKERNLAILKIGGEALHSDRLFLPSSKGHNTNLWTDRSLNTNTKQFNLDFTKYLILGKTDHNISYGGSLSKSQKEMVNQSGDSAINVKWWALYPENCKTSYSSLCGKSNIFSFLVPVKATSRALYFADDFKLNDRISFELGYRYDQIKYQPSYTAGVTPKIPDDIVGGFAHDFKDPYKPVELPKKLPEPKFSDYGYQKVNEYNKEKSKYDDSVVAYNEAVVQNKKIAEKNKLARHQANIDAFVKEKSFAAHSYSLGVNTDPFDFMLLQFKHSKGFRAPTSDEIYFAFKMGDFNPKYGDTLHVVPNIQLKPELAKTNQIALTFYKDFGFITFNYFETKYKNFIDFARTIGYHKNSNGGKTPYEIRQNINRESAKSSGIEINARLNLSILHKALSEFEFSYKFSKQKGRVKVKEYLNPANPNEFINITAPMNAIQPKTSIYGLSYHNTNGKFGVDLYVTRVAAKKASDTYNDTWRETQNEEKITNPTNIGNTNVTTDSSIRWRSDAYTLVDVIAYAKPIKNLILQFGVYNLTNRKYVTWDSARSIRQFGTSNKIDYVTGKGLNRFNAPGRNFKLSAELTF
ncbi:TonB-dependent hemoglobin/transferrin/lactoferrin family receptor [Histophilus somni]|uniref:TonB-dependent hemoglobin/transferrin/lactoferrin family receptor n=2 Tax=Histophilus somni TaxID=731 RepID=UPI00094AD6FC|nr:TonB-dependent hemoglobin/transferrin/lactoferrin family receptor [Histophilus somni]